MVYWVVWVFMILFALLIFLNFIIAEVCESYAVIKADIDALIYKERSGLVHEATNLLPSSIK